MFLIYSNFDYLTRR